jgi:hypothetical protein
VQVTSALRDCLWLAPLLVGPICEDYAADSWHPTFFCHVTCLVMNCSRGVGGNNETESHCAICIMRALWQSPLLGCPILNESCTDTILLLLRVMALHGLCWCIAYVMDQFCQRSACCILYCIAWPSESVLMDGMSNPWLCCCDILKHLGCLCTSPELVEESWGSRGQMPSLQHGLADYVAGMLPTCRRKLANLPKTACRQQHDTWKMNPRHTQFISITADMFKSAQT